MTRSESGHGAGTCSHKHHVSGDHGGLGGNVLRDAGGMHVGDDLMPSMYSYIYVPVCSDEALIDGVLGTELQMD